ncbi:isopentenyl phosphate kinase [Candidatus Poseidoniaceae archaeon]|nr:isopentenyl phosphate kinase [Candidatus Poseidoniaceae archaeon]
MGGTVVIKWGGGLITFKDQLCTVNQEVIDELAEACSKTDKRLVIVHGAGSFGHMKAKKFRLAEGRIDGLSQDEAVEDVRTDMLKLNKYVMDSLAKFGVSAKSYPPHEWARGTGPKFKGDLPVFDGVTVVFGDVVEDDEQEFGILSGDDIILRYATELPDVERAVFAIGGVDGILRVPPARATPDDLIEVWHPELEFEGEHASDIDVTGGIGLKAARGAEISSAGIDVILINGERPGRVIDAIEGKSVIGTRIISGNC